MGETRPIEESKPAEEAKASDEAKPVEESKPVAEAPATLETKPAEESTPVEEAKPAEEPKIAEESEPAEEANAFDDAKPVEESTPAKTLLENSAAIPTGKPGVAATSDDARNDTKAPRRRFDIFRRFGRAAAASATFAASLRPRKAKSALDASAYQAVSSDID